MTKFYRVKTGYGKDDFISVNENELQTAIRAQLTGKVGVFNEGTVSGNHIISITPDYNRELRVARDWQLTSEDYAILGKNKVKEYRSFLQEAKSNVFKQLGYGSSGELKSIEPPEKEVVGKIDENKRIYIIK